MHVEKDSGLKPKEAIDNIEKSKLSKERFALVSNSESELSSPVKWVGADGSFQNLIPYVLCFLWSNLLPFLNQWRGSFCERSSPGLQPSLSHFYLFFLFYFFRPRNCALFFFLIVWYAFERTYFYYSILLSWKIWSFENFHILSFGENRLLESCSFEIYAFTLLLT